MEQAMTKTWQIGYATALLMSAVIVRDPSAAGPRMAPVPEDQRTSEQRELAARFAASGMPNAVATYLNHPSLAKHILPYEHYVTAESTLSPRHRELLGLRV